MSTWGGSDGREPWTLREVGSAVRIGWHRLVYGPVAVEDRAWVAWATVIVAALAWTGLVAWVLGMWQP